MKTRIQPPLVPAVQRGSRGTAVIAVLAVLSVLVVLVAVNARTAWNLKREVVGLEHRQLLRWQAVATNTPGSPVERPSP